MIAKGGAVMGPVLGREAIMQLHLRQDIAMGAVRRFVAAGFTTVYQDILIGADFVRVTAALADISRRVVGLNPSVETLAEGMLSGTRLGTVRTSRQTFLPTP